MKKAMVTMTINGNTVVLPSELAVAYLNQSTANVSTPVVYPEDVSVRKSTLADNKHEYPIIADDKEYTLGCCKVYPTHKMVRQWGGEYRPKNVRYAVKMSLKDGGATWNENTEAYEFHTKKDFDAWVKAQKARQESK